MTMSSWAGVELRHLTVLAAVAEERSFRGAADRLGYVQSAVSQRIAQLEVAVGVRLVERARGHKDVHLTGAGVTLLRHAERIAAQLSAARVELDVGLAELPLDGGPYQSRRLLTDPLVALVPADSPLFDSPSKPTLADLASQPFVVDPTWRMFGLVEAELAATGIELDAHFATRSTATAQALVAAGLGVAIAPRIDVDPNHPETAVIDLGDSLPSRTVVCFWSPDCRAEALRPFLDAIERASLEHRSAAAPGPTESVLTSTGV